MKKCLTIVMNSRYSVVGTGGLDEIQVGWAREAVVFVICTTKNNNDNTATFDVQISPDGANWVNETASIAIGAGAPVILLFVKITNFGNFIRLNVSAIGGTAPNLNVTTYFIGKE